MLNMNHWNTIENAQELRTLYIKRHTVHVLDTASMDAVRDLIVCDTEQDDLIEYAFQLLATVQGTIVKRFNNGISTESSSFISQVYLDDNYTALVVEMRNGNTYAYYIEDYADAVDIMEKFDTFESVGKWYNKMVQGRLKCERV